MRTRPGAKGIVTLVLGLALLGGCLPEFPPGPPGQGAAAGAGGASGGGAGGFVGVAGGPTAGAAQAGQGGAGASQGGSSQAGAAGQASCPGGQKRCGDGCVPPTAAFGCGAADCAPCPEHEHASAYCAAGECAYKCTEPWLEDRGYCYCKSACCDDSACPGGRCVDGECCPLNNPKSECAAFPLCGCAGQQTCDDSGEVRVCKAAGARPEGAACDDDASACAPGLVCLGWKSEQGVTLGSLCFARCGGANEDCGAGAVARRCEAYDQDVRFACTIACDPANPTAGKAPFTACAEGHGCGLGSDALGYHSTCFPAGVGGKGEGCVDAGDCLPGLTCTFTKKCWPMCHVGGTCADGKPCQSWSDHPTLGPVEIGLCP